MGLFPVHLVLFFLLPFHLIFTEVGLGLVQTQTFLLATGHEVPFNEYRLIDMHVRALDPPQ